MIDLDAVRAAPVATSPFTYFVANNVLPPPDLDRTRSDFPAIGSTGVYPPEELTYGPNFAALLDDLRSDEFQDLIEAKLGVSLEGKPLMITVRGHCHPRDGKIHTDSKDKLVTGLLYLNEPDWASNSGRLRLLRSGSNLDDMLAEVPPAGGTLVMFKRADNSWHGHYPYDGPRRYIMFNWLTSDIAHLKNTGRHKLSARIKRLTGLA
jgi:hypothetical protein